LRILANPGSVESANLPRTSQKKILLTSFGVSFLPPRAHKRAPSSSHTHDRPSIPHRGHTHQHGGLRPLDGCGAASVPRRWRANPRAPDRRCVKKGVPKFFGPLFLSLPHFIFTDNNNNNNFIFPKRRSPLAPHSRPRALALSVAPGCRCISGV